MSAPLPSNNHAISRRNPESDKVSNIQLQEFLKEHGISEKEFAEILGVSLQAVVLWTSGKREISVTNSRLIRLFNKYPKTIREF